MPTTPTPGRRAQDTPRRRHAALPDTAAERPRGSPEETARVARLRANLRRLAADNQLNLRQLGERIGSKHGTLFYNFLNGQSHDLSHRTLARICDAFPGLTIDELTGRRAASPVAATPASAVPPRDATGAAAAAHCAALRRSLRQLRAAVDQVERAGRAVCDALAADRPTG